MKNIENYKTRFYTLMESTMGDVKPLISEAPQYEEYVEPEKEDFKVWLEAKNEGIVTNEKSYSNYEYKITARPGSYEPNEVVTLHVLINFNTKPGYYYLKVSDPIKYSGDAIRGKLDRFTNGEYTFTRLGSNLKKLTSTEEPVVEYDIMLKFKMPSTQKEYDSIKPFSKYAEVKFDNVRGGKIKFTILFPDVTINE
jgi:hypothetical protein